MGPWIKLAAAAGGLVAMGGVAMVASSKAPQSDAPSKATTGGPTSQTTPGHKTAKSIGACPITGSKEEVRLRFCSNISQPCALMPRRFVFIRRVFWCLFAQ